MNLLALRDRIRTKAIANSLTYTEIETLFDVNELLNQSMPCLAWRYSGETNNFDEVGTEMSLNIYLLTEFPDSVKTETADYQRDYIVTQQDALRTFFYTWLQAMPFESGSDFLEVISTEEIPIAERLSINAFLTMEFRVNISIKRDFCVEPEEIAPTPSQVQVYFNDVLRYTEDCSVDLELILKNQDGDLINDATFNGYEIVVTQGGGDVTININGVLWDVIAAGDTEDIIVRQSSGSTQVGSKQGQYYRIDDSAITLEDALGTVLSTTNVKAEDAATIIAPNARVSNSDDTYDVNVVSGGDLELPDIAVSNSNDSYSATYPSVQDVELPDVTISNSDNSFTTTSPSVQNIDLADVTISNSDNSYSVTSPSAIDIDTPDITISNSNDSYSVTSPSVKDVDLPNITLANSDGSLTHSIPSVQDITITDVTISNSDSSYSASNPYNPNLSVPDITISNSDDSYSVTSPSVIDVDIPDESITLNSAAFITKPSKKDQDILLKDVSGTTITPVSLSGNTITILDVVKDWDIIIGYSTSDITSTQTMRRAGTITSITTSLTISSITINGLAVSTPITIALNDVLEITYTAAPSDGTIILEGTYV